MDFNSDNIIFLFSILLIIGVITTKFSSRLGVPSLVLFIAVGMALNHFIYFSNAFITQLFGILALIIILFDGGMKTSWKSIKPGIKPAVSLATVGVLCTTFIVGFFAKYTLGISWMESCLLGAIVGSTDAAAVFSVLGNKNIKGRLTSTLEAESGTNDPMAVFLTISFLHLVQNSEAALLPMILEFFWEMGFGLCMGMLMGWISVKTINKINLDSSGLYPVLALSLAILTYSLTSILQGSGFLAVYIMAVYMGSFDFTYHFSVSRFNQGFAWMMQIFMFILLGLLVFPSQLIQISWTGLTLSFILIFVARPIGVFVSTIFSKFSIREKLFVSWAGLRGAVPIVLATYPLLAGAEHAQFIFNTVFFIVLTSALIQGSTIGWLGKVLKLSYGEKVKPPHRIELLSIGKTNLGMLEIQVPPHSKAANKEIGHLEFPADVLVTGIIRGEKLLTPNGDTEVYEGDNLYILTPKDKQEIVKDLFITPLEETLREG
ncbi:potassium/proton antiporter [Aneurinibacillus sp. Ricciae_BoGa-3]|uniref:potassium/proton antiporter n=1 Tax=Aneurinibacillus sp. Ricciae_BoGa-3 TaxID=3022697 RepID=UPI0023417F47|nr:potassium/proton antiporter [Aneurinibacillus sp. Ricciae_BoGa-3]WCK52815.1 potassium/proton antiporter [Aneurinibacillus sp. Ricciae_BoGa-3]